MKTYVSYLLLVPALLLVGCADRVDETVKTEQPRQEKEVAAEWLDLDEKFGAENVKAYDELIESVVDGDSEATMNLVGVSQQIADDLMRTKERSEAFRFYRQAARALRLAMELGVEDLPYPSFAAVVYFDEAKALAVQGDTDKALSSLNASFENGFDEIDSLQKSGEFSKVRELEQYKSMLPTWTELAEQNLLEEARRMLSQGKSYPFTFSDTDVDSNKQNLESLKGKVVIVDFWGTWCGPCVNELPSFIALQEKYGDKGFQMIGLNYEHGQTQAENRRLVKKMIENAGINYPCILGDEKTQSQVPNFNAFPTTVFIDMTGKVRLTLVGGQREALLEAIVRELISE